MADAKIVLSASDQTKSAFDSAQRNMRSLESQAGSVSSAMAKMGISLSAALSVSWIKSVVDSLDHLNDLSQKTGIAADTLGGLGFAATQSGGDLEGVTAAAGKLNKSLAEAAAGNKEMVAAFGAMGISATDASGKTKTVDVAMAEIADKFSTYKNGPEKVALAMKLFGKAGADQISMLNEGGDKLRENVDYYKRFSGVTVQLTQDADLFNDTLGKVNLISGSLGTTIAAALMPSMQAVADEFLSMKEQGSSFSVVAEAIKTVFESLAITAANVSFVFKGVGREIGAIVAQGVALANGDLNGFTAISEAVKADGVRARAELDSLERLILGTIRYSPDDQSSAEANRLGIKKQPAKKDAPRLPPPAGNVSDSEIKKFTSALQGLEQQLGSLNHQTEAEKVIYQLTSGSLKDLTDAHKAEILSVAGEIDIRKQLEDQLKREQDELLRVATVRDNGLAIQASAIVAGRNQLDQYQFETSLIGKTAQQQAILNAERQIDLQMRAQLKAAADNAGDNNQQFEKDQKNIEAAAQALRDGLIPAMRERMELETSWSTGSKAAIDDYLNNINNAATQSKNLLTNAFKGMEDALVNFVKTGKLDFASLADSIVSDLIRIQIQKSIVGPMAASMSGFLGLSFDGGGFTGPGARAGGMDGKGGFMAMLHPNETVLDHTKGQSAPAGQSVTVVQNFTVGDVASVSMVRQAVAGSERRIAGAMGRSMNYGGALA